MTSLSVGQPTDHPQRSMTRSAVVVNPSKLDDIDGYRRQVCAALTAAGWAEPVWLTTTVDDPGCGMTRQAVDSGARVVFACGGDGTVMACAAVLAGTDVALAVLPAGTGNLLAGNLDLPGDVAAGVALATGGHRRRIDVGVVGDAAAPRRHGGIFTVMAGMGFDAQVLDSTTEGHKKRFGPAAYVAAALHHLRHRPIQVRIHLDDAAPIRRRARTVLVANVGRLHAGICLLPDANPDDGWLDVAVLTPTTLRNWMSLTTGVICRQRHVANRETFRARRIEILSNRVQPRELDGEVIAPARSLVVTVQPGALTVCAQPPASPAGQHGQRVVAGVAQRPEGGGAVKTRFNPYTSREGWRTMTARTQQWKGRIKQAAGSLTGNRRLENQGAAHRQTGDVNQQLARAKGKVNRVIDKTASSIKKALDAKQNRRRR